MIEGQRRSSTTPYNYSKVHRWLHKNYGKAVRCENPKCTGTPTKFMWAKKLNKLYEEKRDNFVQLCVKCHLEYDGVGKKVNKGKYITVTYRITEKQDTKIKRLAKKRNKNQNQILRTIIEESCQ